MNVHTPNVRINYFNNTNAEQLINKLRIQYALHDMVRTLYSHYYWRHISTLNNIVL